MSLDSRIHIDILALPIGNPEDLSLRGRASLERADRVFCEDSRKLHALLQALGISLQEGCRVTSLPGNEEWNFKWDHLREDASKKKDDYYAVMVSDAGTPALNDPGRALAEHALRQGWNLRALPGPSAPMMALQWTGGFGLPFVFFGFVPKAKGKAWKEFLSSLDASGTLACFETRHQIVETLEALLESGHSETWGHLGRERARNHEARWSGSVREILERVRHKLERDDAIGEMTLLFQGQRRIVTESRLHEDPQGLARKILSVRELPPKAASKVLAELSGLEKDEAYRLLAEAKGSKESKE